MRSRRRLAREFRDLPAAHRSNPDPANIMNAFIPARATMDSVPTEWCESMQALAVAALFCLLGCADPLRNEIIHPTPENLPPDGSPSIRSEGAPVGLSVELLADWMEVRDALLREAETTVSLGHRGIDADAQDVFGMEIDVALDAESRILVLDRRNQRIGIFGNDGRYLGEFGRAGSGPGEFRDPTAIEMLADGQLAVVDRGNAIKIFASTDSGYTHIETYVVPLVPEGACSIGGRLFVSGWDSQSGGVIHEVANADVSDSVVRSFGQGYSSGYWLVQQQLSEGPIACMEGPPRVFFAFERVPVVRAYSEANGALLWAATLTDYLQPPLIEEIGVGLGISGRVAQDVVTNLVAVPSGHLVLQTLRMPPRSPGEMLDAEEIEIRTYLVDGDTGQGAFISASLPMMPVVTEEYYLAVWFLPFPRLELRRWTPIPSDVFGLGQGRKRASLQTITMEVG